MKFLSFCVGLGTVIIFINLFFAVKCARKGDKAGRHLQRVFLMSTLVTVSYLISVNIQAKRSFAIFSAIYYASIDLMLYELLLFAEEFVKTRKDRRNPKRLNRPLLIVMIFDMAVELINPFLNYFAIDFAETGAKVPAFDYVFRPLYLFHLCFCYFLIAMFLVRIIAKCMRVPNEYRIQYWLTMISLVVILAANAIFLFVPGNTEYAKLDYSVIGYCCAEIFLYWTYYSYATTGMMTRFRQYVFASIDQGIVMFDFDGNMVLWNQRIKSMVPGDYSRRVGIDWFLERSGIRVDLNMQAGNQSFLCYVAGTTDLSNEEMQPMRCDYRVMENEDGELLGRLFVFTDEAVETDIVTGFRMLDNFKAYLSGNPRAFGVPAVICVCDINGLAALNHSQGREEGDRKLHQLAAEMKKHMPRATEFIRGPEADLVAVSSGCSQEQLKACLEEICSAVDFGVQYAMGTTSEEDPDVIAAMQRAIDAMKNRKLLDRTSGHSGTLTSLITALQECDSDTEEHVQRTRNIGQALGKRIGLSDLEMSQLSLLCLMHDIGKIGVPLEILNKPGKLNEAEFTVLRSHARKGYEICRSSPELIGISDMVLHHHERWDGKGYPDGQSGEEIPLLSRIISVVDAYDAMVSERIYSPAIPEQAARTELIRCAGTQFDPTIVAEFVRLVEEESFYDIPEQERMKPESGEIQLQSAGISIGNVHNISYASYTMDSSMKIVAVDPEFEAMTGYTFEDVKRVRLKQIDLIPPEDRAEYAFTLNIAGSGRTQAFLQHRILTKSGDTIDVLCYGRDFFDSATKEMRSQIIIADLSNAIIENKETKGEGKKTQ